MQIYWTLKSVPELSGLPTDDERRRVWRDAYRKLTRRSWQFWVSLVGFGLCVHIGDHIYYGIGGLIGVVVGVFIFSQVQIHLARPYIRALLSPEHASGR